MAETRLQSQMLDEIGRSARAAMLQRAQISANQRAWLDYAYARDAGAFYGDPYGGDSSGEHLIGQANPYAKYYAAQQAKQLAFQRQRFLNAQSFQNNYMLQQQKFMLGQAAEEQEAARTKQEMDRKLAVVSSELDALENNPEVDKNSWEYKARRQQLLDDRYQLETDLERNTPQVHEEDSGFKDSQGNPIMSRFIIDKDGKPIYHVQGKDVASNQLERDKFEQAKIDAARKANHDEAVLEETRFNNRTARLKERNTQAANERKASGAVDSTEMYKEKMKIRDEIRKERTEANKLAKAEEWKKWTEANPDATDDEKQQAKINIALENELNDDVEVQEINDRYDRRQLLREPELTPEQGKTTVQYEQPGDSMYQEEMPDEQFAGTEPAGLYDPTGQPLPMDGGMYNGLA